MGTSTEIKMKVGLVLSEAPSKWVSCRHINEGLSRAYESVAEVCKYYLYGRSSQSVVDAIIKSEIECLVFLDHQVRPLEIIISESLVHHLREKKIKIILHTYGCFIDRLNEYQKILTLLEGCDIQFVASSPKQKKLIEYSLLSPEKAVQLIPFPLIQETLEPQKSREQLRRELGLPLEGKVFLYTGRISAFKNVELVMETFSKLRSMDSSLCFVYVGSFDNFESFSNNDSFSNQAIINAKLLNRIDPDREWCFYRGFQDDETLQKYYLAADAFISLSINRGEDFGMSILEASSYGLPCFLTDWGGYSGFSELEETFYTTVEITNDDIFIDISKLKVQLLSFSPITEENKVKKMKSVEEKYGFNKTALRIRELLNQSCFHALGFKKELLVQRQLLRRNRHWDVYCKMKDVYEIYAEPQRSL